MENTMYIGRCLRCKAKKEIQNPEIKQFGTKGMRAVQGTCPICGTKMFRILPKEKK